jgi:hypothetical protein
MKYQGRIYVTPKLLETDLTNKEVTELLDQFEAGTIDSISLLRYGELLMEILELKSREK